MGVKFAKGKARAWKAMARTAGVLVLSVAWNLAPGVQAAQGTALVGTGILSGCGSDIQTVGGYSSEQVVLAGAGDPVSGGFLIGADAGTLGGLFCGGSQVISSFAVNEFDCANGVLDVTASSSSFTLRFVLDGGATCIGGGSISPDDLFPGGTSFFTYPVTETVAGFQTCVNSSITSCAPGAFVLINDAAYVGDLLVAGTTTVCRGEAPDDYACRPDGDSGQADALIIIYTTATSGTIHTYGRNSEPGAVGWWIDFVGGASTCSEGFGSDWSLERVYVSISRDTSTACGTPEASGGWGGGAHFI